MLSSLFSKLFGVTRCSFLSRLKSSGCLPNFEGLIDYSLEKQSGLRTISEDRILVLPVLVHPCQWEGWWDSLFIHELLCYSFIVCLQCMDLSSVTSIEMLHPGCWQRYNLKLPSLYQSQVESDNDTCFIFICSQVCRVGLWSFFHDIE